MLRHSINRLGCLRVLTVRNGWENCDGGFRSWALLTTIARDPRTRDARSRPSREISVVPLESSIDTRVRIRGLAKQRWVALREDRLGLLAAEVLLQKFRIVHKTVDFI